MRWCWDFGSGLGWMLEILAIEVKGRINKVPAEGLAPIMTSVWEELEEEVLRFPVWINLGKIEVLRSVDDSIVVACSFTVYLEASERIRWVRNQPPPSIESNSFSTNVMDFNASKAESRG